MERAESKQSPPPPTQTLGDQIGNVATTESPRAQEVKGASGTKSAVDKARRKRFSYSEVDDSDICSIQ